MQATPFLTRAPNSPCRPQADTEREAADAARLDPALAAALARSQRIGRQLLRAEEGELHAVEQLAEELLASEYKCVPPGTGARGWFHASVRGGVRGGVEGCKKGIQGGRGRGTAGRLREGTPVCLLPPESFRFPHTPTSAPVSL